MRRLLLGTGLALTIVTNFSCANEPVQFSQGDTGTTLNMNVEKAPAKKADAVKHPSRDIDDDELASVFDDANNSSDSGSTAAAQVQKTSGASADAEAEGAQEGSAGEETNAKSDADHGSSEEAAASDEAGGTTDDSMAGSEDGSGAADGNGGNKDSSLPKDFSRPNPGERKACARLTGVETEDVVTNVNAKQKSYSVVAVKVVGNQTDVKLNLAGDGAILQGVCIFVAGNKSSVKAKFGLKIENFVYFGTGNSTEGTVTLSKDGSMTEAAVGIAGNGATLDIESNGGFDCNGIRINGKRSRVTCH